MNGWLVFWLLAALETALFAAGLAAFGVDAAFIFALDWTASLGVSLGYLPFAALTGGLGHCASPPCGPARAVRSR